MHYKNDKQKPMCGWIGPTTDDLILVDCPDCMKQIKEMIDKLMRDVSIEEKEKKG